jgi:hypothetical protein
LVKTFVHKGNGSPFYYLEVSFMCTSRLAFSHKRLSLLVLLLALLALGVPQVAAYAASPTAVQIGDFVWREGRFNHDGIQQLGEQGLAYAPVNLYQGTTLVSITNASALGIYALEVTTPGAYIIEMPIPSYPNVGLLSSPQNTGSNDNLDSDVSVALRRAPITIGATNNLSYDGAVYDSLDSITYCTGKPLTFTDWNETFDLQKSDPSYGTLVGVYLRATAGSAQNASLTNNDGAPQTFTYIGGAVNDVTLPDGTMVTTQTGRRVNGIILDAGATRVFDDLVDYKTTDVVIDPTNFGFYQGDGGLDDFFSMPAQAKGVTTIIGGGNIVAIAQTRSYSTVCVTYVYENPLAVELSDFQAMCHNDTNVTVTWETASEVDTLGFNLLRAPTEAGTPTPLNQEMIPAQTPGGSGSSYAWEDTEPKANGTYWYWLDALDTDGTATRYGPVNASVPCSIPTALTLGTLESTPGPRAMPVALWAGLAVAAMGIIVLRRRF